MPHPTRRRVMAAAALSGAALVTAALVTGPATASKPASTPQAEFIIQGVETSPFTKKIPKADYQVRRYPAWYRHITLALLAHAYLAVTRSRAAAPASPELLPLTVPEVRRLLCRLVWTPVVPAEQVLAWSRWRRRHQARARRCHYRRRLRQASA